MRDGIEAQKALGLTPERDWPSELSELQSIAKTRPRIDLKLVAQRPPGLAKTVRVGAAHTSVDGEPAESIWRRCSGLPHGRSWAAMSVLDRDQITRHSPGVLTTRMTSSATDVAQWTKIVMMLMHEAREMFADRCTPP